MHSFLNLLLYRHRRFKGETYFKNRFPLMLVISSIFAVFIADTFNSILITVVIFLLLDLLLSFFAWIYYRTGL